jgi:putative membrane protein
MMHGYGWYGGMGWMWIWWLIGAAAVVALVLLVLRLTSDKGGRGGGTPRDTAKERYARGEITRDEYLRLIEDLGR